MNRTGHRTLLPLLAAALLSTGLASADFESAMQNFKAGKYVEAAGQFQELVDNAPSYDYGYYMLGVCFLKTKAYQDAETNLRKAIELNGDRFEYHQSLATAHFHRKQYGKAIAALKTAEPLAKDSNAKFQLYKLRGYCYSGEEKWGEAIEDLERAKAIKSTAGILDRLGTAYYNLGHYDKALAPLRAVLESAPSNSAILKKLGNSLINLGTEARDAATEARYYREGLEVAKKLQQVEPNDFDSHNMVGRAALGAKEYATAVQAFRKVLALKSDYCYAMVNLGKVHIAQQAWTEAEAILKDAAECAPRMAVVYENLGFATQKQKRLADAAQYYEMALNIKPSPTTQKMLEVVQKNMAIAADNEEMARLEREQDEAARKAEAEYREAMEKQAEWEKRRKRDQ